MSFGFWELVLVLMIVLVLFGAGKLPKVMGDVGKGIRNLKDGLKEEDKIKLEQQASSSPTSNIENIENKEKSSV